MEAIPLKIIVAGCGKIGTSILRSLLKDGHAVTAIDSDSDNIAALNVSQDIIGICGSCTDSTALKDAGISSCDLFIAATESDELNMLSCFIAKKLGAKKTIARIRSFEYSQTGLDDFQDYLELDAIVNPELLTAKAIFNSIKYPNAIRCESFTRSRFRMVQFAIKEGDSLCGVTLKDLRPKMDSPFLVCAVQRSGKVIIPNGDFRFEAGDRVYVNETEESALSYYGEKKHLFHKLRKSGSVMIIGASRVATYLCELLVKGNYSVKVIEKDKDVCNKAAGEYSESIEIINGDGTNQSFLDDERIDQYDAFIALTGNDEINILTSVYASERGIKKVISKVNRTEYLALSDKIGIDCRMSPSMITSDAVLRYARAIENSQGSNIQTMYSLFDGGIEALEFEVSASFTACSVPLKNLQIKPDILIAGIIRGSENIIPSGSDVILPDDRVIIVSSTQRLTDLSEILK